MELTTMQMYWIVTLDAINNAAIMVITFSIVLSIFVLWNIPVMEKKEEKNDGWEIIKQLYVIAAISGLLFTFLPSTKQMAAIMIVPKIANSEKAQTIDNKVYDLAVEWMNELKPSKKEGAK